MADDFMGWNYRLTVQKVGDEQVWAVREFYYDEAGNVVAWTEDAVHAEGETWDEVANDLEHMGEALTQPTFDLDTQTWLKDT